MVVLTLPIPPSSNHYKKPRRKQRRKQRAFYLTDEAITYKDTVRLLVREAGIYEPYSWERVRVTLVVYNCQQDEDNTKKVLYDSLSGVLWIDDKRIVHSETFTIRKETVARKAKRVKRIVLVVEECTDNLEALAAARLNALTLENAA